MYRFNALLTNNGAWHQYCMTWSSLNGAIHAYVDGARVTLDNTAPLRVTLPQTHFELETETTDYTYYVSEVNAWDHVLPLQEIQRSSLECFSASGNLVAWQDVKEEIEGTDLFVEISTCPAEPEESPDNGDEITQKRKDQALRKYTRKHNEKPANRGNKRQVKA